MKSGVGVIAIIVLTEGYMEEWIFNRKTEGISTYERMAGYLLQYGYTSDELNQEILK